MRAGLFVVSLLTVVVTFPADLSAQNGATLSERIAAAIARHEPSWQVVQPFSPPNGGSVEPKVTGRWQTADRPVQISLSLFDSPADASEYLTLVASGWSVGPVSIVRDGRDYPQPPGYAIVRPRPRHNCCFRSSTSSSTYPAHRGIASRR
jgi:hypothetical protein